MVVDQDKLFTYLRREVYETLGLPEHDEPHANSAIHNAILKDRIFTVVSNIVLRMLACDWLTVWHFSDLDDLPEPGETVILLLDDLGFDLGSLQRSTDTGTIDESRMWRTSNNWYSNDEVLKWARIPAHKKATVHESKPLGIVPRPDGEPRYKIVRDAPELPGGRRYRPARVSGYPITIMLVGDSFMIPDEELPKDNVELRELRARIYSYGQNRGMKLSIKRRPDGFNVRRVA